MLKNSRTGVRYGGSADHAEGKATGSGKLDEPFTIAVP
jgi:hypothetical protein